MWSGRRHLRQVLFKLFHRHCGLVNSIQLLTRPHIRPLKREPGKSATIKDAIIIQTASTFYGKECCRRQNVNSTEQPQFCRRFFSSSYAILSNAFGFAWYSSSALIGVRYPMGSSRRRLLTPSTYLSVAHSTTSADFHGPNL